MSDEYRNRETGCYVRPEWKERLTLTGLTLLAAAPWSHWGRFTVTKESHDTLTPVTVFGAALGASAGHFPVDTGMEVSNMLPAPQGMLITELRVVIPNYNTNPNNQGYLLTSMVAENYIVDFMVGDKRHVRRVIGHGQTAPGMYVFDLSAFPVIVGPEEFFQARVYPGCAVDGAGAPVPTINGQGPVNQANWLFNPWALTGWVVINGVILRPWA